LDPKYLEEKNMVFPIVINMYSMNNESNVK
jgi:hypothetical protein